MNSPRLKQLLEFFHEDPNDAFTIYAIATEYRKTDLLKSLEFYERLLQHHENYLPTYYHIAQLYLDSGQRKKAETVYVKGIQIAKDQGNALLLRELQNAYNNFLFEED